MLTIGFSNKFYTLWDITTEVNTDDHGVRHERTNYRYLKNISFDKETALSKYPEANIDEDLHGHRHSFSYERVVYPDNVFKYGKYRGMLFTEVKDYEYMAWYFTTTDVVSQEELIPILERHGYHCFPYFDKTWGIETEEEYLKRLAHDAALDSLRENIINELGNGTAEFFIDHNPNENGEYYDNKSEFTLKFDVVRSNYYQGFEYYLPVLNGKCKRVKNKRIRITEAELNDSDILVHNFEVIK